MNIITHPSGYSGTGGTVDVSVCIDPSSANSADMEISVRNIVNVYRHLQSVTGNLVTGAANDIAANEIDFESTALHEIGHCLGLAHVNLSSESGLIGSDREYTKSTDGANNSWDLDAASDGVIGSSDDLRDDDQNLFYFRKSNNNPFTIEATTIDSTTYSRLLSDLPAGHSYPVNGARAVAALLSLPASTEAVMQQGAFFDEAQRSLSHDDVAALRLAMSGVDELQGTADDYDLQLSYAGLTGSCDIVLKFDNSETNFALCESEGAYLNWPTATHTAITTAVIYFNDGYNWHFSPELTHCGNGELDDGEECDDGDTLPGDGCSTVCSVEFCGDGTLNTDEDCDDGGNADGDCCSASCEFEAPGNSCDDGDACTLLDSCDGGGSCAAGSPLDCSDGIWCNGEEICDSGLGCQAGTPVDIDDDIGCTDDACDEANKQVEHIVNQANCDDGLWCNGLESCHAYFDCRPGLAPEADDGVDCTVAFCDEALDSIVHQAKDVLCNDTNACTVDTCDAMDGCHSEAIDACHPIPTTNRLWELILAISMLIAGSMLSVWRGHTRAH